MKKAPAHHAIIVFNKLRNVKEPLKAHYNDAGFDFFVPEFDTEFIEELKRRNPNSNFDYIYNAADNSCQIRIPAHEGLHIPSGIRTIIPDSEHALIAFNKSGIATKKGLLVGACVIDAGYHGEIGLHLINTTNDKVCFWTGDKITQFVYLETPSCGMEEYDAFDYEAVIAGEKRDARGTGGFGSTGLKN